MALTSQDFTLYSGDTSILEFTLTEQDGTTPLNLDGLSAINWAFSKIRPTGYGARILQKTLASGVTIINSELGRVDVALAPVDTATLKAGQYHHELEVTDLLSNVTTVAVGTMTIVQDIN